MLCADRKTDSVGLYALIEKLLIGKLRMRGGASSALQLMIFPELNFIEKRGGVNAVVRF